MALYLISYDILDKDKFEYDPLWRTLEAMGATKILYSEWAIVRSMNEATAIYDQLRPFVSAKDRLLVQELRQNARWDKLLISDEAFVALLKQARA